MDQHSKSIDPPSELDTCSRCKYWCARVASVVAMIGPNVAVPVPQFEAMKRDALKAGNPVPKELARVEAAPCTRFPQWTNNPGDHWCWEFRDRDR